MPISTAVLTAALLAGPAATPADPVPAVSKHNTPKISKQLKAHQKDRFGSKGFGRSKPGRPETVETEPTTIAVPAGTAIEAQDSGQTGDEKVTKGAKGDKARKALTMDADAQKSGDAEADTDTTEWEAELNDAVDGRDDGKEADAPLPVDVVVTPGSGGPMTLPKEAGVSESVSESEATPSSTANEGSWSEKHQWAKSVSTHNGRPRHVESRHKRGGKHIDH
jgi:hypothetical protein